MAEEVLYRKYRAKKFSEIVGQEYIVTIIKNAITSNALPHCYLFTGPRGTGKTSLARILAMTLNCPEVKAGEPCGTCNTCQSISKSISVDTIEIDAASNRGIDDIRKLREAVKYKPMEGKYKVYIIDEVHMLTNEAFNALLKTLEEPPVNVMFILATTEIHKVPLTIQSRSQKMVFNKITLQKNIDYIKNITQKEKIKTDDESLALIAQSADGSIRDALSILDQLATLSNKNIENELVRKVLGIPNETLITNLLTHYHENDTTKVLEDIQNLYNAGLTPFEITKHLINTINKLFKMELFSISKIKRASCLSSEALAKEETAPNVSSPPESRLTNISIPSTHFKSLMNSLIDKINTIKYSDISDTILETIIMTTNEEQSLSAIGQSHLTTPSTPKITVKPIEDIKSNVKTLHVKSEDVLKEQSRTTSQENQTPQDPNASTTIGKITFHWSEILKELKKIKLAVYLLLENAKPHHVEGNKVMLSFVEGYSFHCEKMKSKENTDILKEAAKTVMQQDIDFDYFVQTENTTSQQPSSNQSAHTEEVPKEVEKLANLFNGKVVDRYK
ncbi:DNA polymerase III subunit gamma/tau [Candidatus Margulisiibacteriota bacterium]